MTVQEAIKELRKVRPRGGIIPQKQAEAMSRLTEWIDDGENRCAVPRMGLRNIGHRACCNKLAHYEDLEEQGLLMKLRCKVGDKAYHIIEDNMAIPPIYISEHEIQDVSAKAVYFADDWWSFEEMREMNAYLNKAEAEKALADMRKKV